MHSDNHNAGQILTSDNLPLVSVCCLTYNHAPYIRRCLDGILGQLVNFKYEVLIHDDCSSDGTDDIIREYQSKYPDIIFPLFESENQYSKGKAAEIDFFNYKRARGQFIAYCEGDDYWTDPNKLQKQIDFLIQHPDYSICFHLAIIHEENTGTFRDLKIDFPGGLTEDIDVSPTLFLTSTIGQPLSMVFRKSIYSFEWFKHYSRYFDTIEIYHILRTGKGRMMKFIGGQYNLHDGGVSATCDDSNRSVISFNMFLEMYSYTKDSILISFVKDTALWCERATRHSEKYNDYKTIMKKCAKCHIGLYFNIAFTTYKRRLKSLWKK